MREEKTYLEDILESINRIERYIKDLKPMDFLESEMTQDGVMKRIEIIGEAVKHLSDKMKDKYPEIPWKNIARAKASPCHWARCGTGKVSPCHWQGLTFSLLFISGTMPCPTHHW